MKAKIEAEGLFIDFNNKGLHQISSVINRFIRKEMIKQCAIFCVEEKIKYAKTFGDVAELDITHFKEVIKEIENL